MLLFKVQKYSRSYSKQGRKPLLFALKPKSTERHQKKEIAGGHNDRHKYAPGKKE